MKSIGIETIIAKPRNVDGFLKRICKNIESVKNSRNIKYWYDLDQIDLVEFYVNRKKSKYKLFSKKFSIDFSNFVFLPVFLNKIGENKIPYFFHDDSLYIDTFSSHEMSISVIVNENIRFCFEFREECKCFMLVRMCLQPKFISNDKYKFYEVVEPYKSVRTW